MSDAGSPPTTRVRLAYLDNLKIGLIAGIIAAHGINSYTDFGSWAYQDVQEVAVSEATETIFTVVLSFAALFLMGLFFFISGLLTPPSLERKGVRRFVDDRLLRLGYAAWWAMRSPTTTPEAGEPLRARTAVGLGAIVAVTSFLVRLEFPVNSPQVVNLHLWEWPQCLGMFLFGTVCVRRGWLAPVPDRLRCGVVSLIAGASVAAMILTADALGLDENDYFGGSGWPSLATSIAEGALVVAACIWLLGFAQRRLDRQGRLGRALARSAYGAFLVQGPVLIVFAFAMRPLDLPGEVKALVLATTGVVVSFALAWPLVTRTGLRRIL